ncbi:hypothetical protein FPQ18DRAFT_392681 [Pyronema domesticum]|uniref:Uncharacterized protein n=1 Tax=Pyronema omphalodes (strain CBS 100304) TaxID=1076935 RepID=U4LIE0_PYROM|nr:hypothetical protein FPQ18DRAFT_392681 [Pyronema domesticum]CCX31703.1 Protein of unknown function [Pyronema omphalodes CBS 100304]
MDTKDTKDNKCLCRECDYEDFEDWTWVEFIIKRPCHSYKILQALRRGDTATKKGESFPPNLRCPPKDWDHLLQAFRERRKINRYGIIEPAFTSVYNRDLLYLVHKSIEKQQLRESMKEETVAKYVAIRARQIINSINDTPGATKLEASTYDLCWYEFVERLKVVMIRRRKEAKKVQKGEKEENEEEYEEEYDEEDPKADEKKEDGTAWLDYIFANPETTISNLRQKNGGDPARFPRLLCSDKDFEILLKAFDKLGKNDHVDYDEENGITPICQHNCFFSINLMLCVSLSILHGHLRHGMPENEAFGLKDERSTVIMKTIRKNLRTSVRKDEVEFIKRWAEFLGYIRGFKEEAMMTEQMKDLELSTGSSGEVTKEVIKEVTKEVTKKVTKEATKEASKEASKEETNEASKEGLNNEWGSDSSNNSIRRAYKKERREGKRKAE